MSKHNFNNFLYSSTPIEENLRDANYYAPRGRKRLFLLGSQLAQRYLQASDYLIGIIGSEGSGKSTLIKGLFPGLELTNDDDGLNVRSTPIFDFSEDEFFCPHTYHLDIRYELAFHQMHEIVDAIKRVLQAQKRVIVEHFDLVYPHLGHNAQLIIAIGEEVSIYRPTIFGPSPIKMKEKVDKEVRYRLMAHSAEDLVGFLLEKMYGVRPQFLHSDVPHGFMLKFKNKPNIDLHELEKNVLESIGNNIDICAGKGDHISLGGEEVVCTGKRLHVKSTGEIKNFRLYKDFIFDPISEMYLMVAMVGEEELGGLWESPFNNELIRNIKG